MPLETRTHITSLKQKCDDSKEKKDDPKRNNMNQMFSKSNNSNFSSRFLEPCEEDLDDYDEDDYTDNDQNYEKSEPFQMKNIDATNLVSSVSPSAGNLRPLVSVPKYGTLNNNFNGYVPGQVKFVNSTIEILQNQMKKEDAPKKKRTRTSPDQLRILQKAYNQDSMPNSTARLQLAKKLGMNARAVQVWFQNRRAKGKLDSRRIEGRGEVDNSGSDKSLATSPESYSSYSNRQVITPIKNERHDTNSFKYTVEPTEMKQFHLGHNSQGSINMYDIIPTLPRSYSLPGSFLLPNSVIDSMNYPSYTDSSSLEISNGKLWSQDLFDIASCKNKNYLLNMSSFLSENEETQNNSRSPDFDIYHSKPLSNFQFSNADNYIPTEQLSNYYSNRLQYQMNCESDECLPKSLNNDFPQDQQNDYDLSQQPFAARRCFSTPNVHNLISDKQLEYLNLMDGQRTRNEDSCSTLGSIHETEECEMFFDSVNNSKSVCSTQDALNPSSDLAAILSNYCMDAQDTDLNQTLKFETKEMGHILNGGNFGELDDNQQQLVSKLLFDRALTKIQHN